MSDMVHWREGSFGRVVQFIFVFLQATGVQSDAPFAIRVCQLVMFLVGF